MNRSESKYRNTARLMNQALLLLLEKKDFEFITIKEICEKAGVNRSTFYLHYENVNDLLEETIEELNKEFQETFSAKHVSKKIIDSEPEEVMFIRCEFLIPYLEFVKRNLRVLKVIHNKPLLFKNDMVYKKMKEEIFFPALSKFQIKDKDQPYLLEFFTKGVTGIISQWIELDCKDDVDYIAHLIINCVGFKR